MNTDSEAHAKHCVVLYQQLYPHAPSLLESTYQVYRQSEARKQATHVADSVYQESEERKQATCVRVFSWLLENHSNPYTVFGSKLAEITKEPKLGKIYQDWYQKQRKALVQRLNRSLLSIGVSKIHDVLEMFNTLMLQIEARCAQANTYDDVSWVLLFLFLEMAIITQDGKVAPEALITALQNQATPTGKEIIRKAVAQPYLRDLIKSEAFQLKSQASQRRNADQSNQCVIL